MRKRIDRIMKVLEAISNGQIGKRVAITANNDEIDVIGQGINDMAESLLVTIKNVKNSISTLSATSNELMSTAREAEQGVKSQSNHFREISATIENLTKSSDRISENSSELAQMAEQTLQTSTSGRDVVESMMKEIENINNQNGIIGEKILEVNYTTQQIESILVLIEKISEKTDILALNAALEGTKAGGAGEGFSLVAMEMKRMAENVANSTKDIKELIKNIQDAVNSSVIATEDGMKIAKHGEINANATMESFTKIYKMVHNTSSAINNISSNTMQQNSSTKQVLNSIVEMTGIIKQIMVGNKQMANGAIELNEMAENLQDLIKKFEIADNGESNKS
jgi:methyl-accepting chemotaxis protein